MSWPQFGHEKLTGSPQAKLFPQMHKLYYNVPSIEPLVLRGISVERGAQFPKQLLGFIN